MTDSEIITALTVCHKGNGESECEKCPYVVTRGCIDILGEDALDLIKRQQAEIDTMKDTMAKLLNTLERANKYRVKEMGCDDV